MKTKNKMSLIAGIAALTLVGTGYAAWTFSKDATATFDGSVSIIGKTDEVGTLAVKSGTVVKLILDQKEDGGVYWADNSGSALENIVLEYLGVDREVEETITINVIPTYGGKLSDYVSFDDFATVDSQTWTGGTTALSFTFALPSVEYTDLYPLNEAVYDQMVTDLSGASISFAFEAAVDECTH